MTLIFVVGKEEELIMQKQSPLLRIWGWGKDEHSSLIFAIISAFVGVALGMLPYFAAAQIIIGMLAGETDLSAYLPWLGRGLADGAFVARDHPGGHGIHDVGHGKLQQGL